MIRLLLLFLLFWAGYFLVGAFNKRGRSVNDFERVQVTNYRSYIKKTYGSPTYTRIVIESDAKEYFLFPHDELIPEGIIFDEIIPILNRSTEAVLWIEEFDDGYSVMGLEIGGRLIIPPTQGVKFHEKQRRVGLWGAAGFIAMAAFGYFYFRRHDGLDWKLSPKG